MDLNAELIALLNIKPISNHVYSLIELGANPDTLNHNGYSLLHLLVLNNQIEDAYYLIKNHKVNVNVKDKRGFTPLYYMLNESYTPESIIQMIRLGASPLIRNRKGQAPIHYLLQNYHFSYTLQLLEVHPESSGLSSQDGCPLELMLNNRHRQKYTADNYLTIVRCGANPSTRDAFGSTLLSIILNTASFDKAEELVALSKIHPSDRLYFKPEYIDLFITEDGISDLICNLREKKYKSREIAYLARYPSSKERVIETIKNLDSEQQKEILKECLDPSSQLNAFFAVPRGWFKTSNERGTLLQIKQLSDQIESTDTHQSIEKQYYCLF
ncbi:ankyrin repeat domain-containing protein [Legionella waltersii]|uniref:Ankyrin repeat protein n=1 Tax=Legionella waltersii TaxID=66969 RepID=A0A0W1A1P0_9GAMM|nr:ankyrin repeat domain-containing protein [Legionella waltersii]KTD75281.1 ankyrin repeat protein [Legionella waltersii]SNV06901.1 ankyrin repeat protein [Legionella waltersii]